MSRAERHLNELRTEVSDYLARKPIALIVEAPEAFANLGCHTWTARIRETVPHQFATIIGDIVHNLRSALDLLATDLVRLNGKQPKNVYFPFANSAAALEGQLKDKKLNLAHPDVVDLVRTLRPYTGGNQALRGLHDLDIQDKHQALIPTVSVARTTPFFLHIGNKMNAIPAWESAILRDGFLMVIMPTASNLSLGSEVACHFSLVFPADTAFAGCEVVKTCESLRENVGSALEAFATLCKGQAFPESTPS